MNFRAQSCPVFNPQSAMKPTKCPSSHSVSVQKAPKRSQLMQLFYPSITSKGSECTVLLYKSISSPREPTLVITSAVAMQPPSKVQAERSRAKVVIFSHLEGTINSKENHIIMQSHSIFLQKGI